VGMAACRAGHAEGMNTVVIAGAGYAGLSTVLELTEHLDRRDELYDREVIVVNDAPYHVFTMELHSLAAGVEDEEDVEVPLDRILRTPFRLVVDRVERVEPGAHVVHLASGRAIRYRELVLAVGSVPEDYGIAGVHRYASWVSTPRAALGIRARLDSLAARGYGDVVLVGAGLTGTELAAEIQDTYRHRVSVHLLEAGPRILPDIEEGLVHATERLLREKGVRIRTAVTVVDVTQDAVETEGQGRIPYDLLIWTAGVRAHPLVARSGFPTDDKGRAVTDAYLRVRGEPDVYAAGDCAAFPLPAGGYLAPTAQAAVQMGRAVARNVLYALDGELPEPYEPHIRGFFASLGEWEGVGQAGREAFFGLPAMLIRRLIEAHHAFEAGGTHALLRHLMRNGERLLWGSMVGERRYVERSRQAAGSADANPLPGKPARVEP